MTDEEYQKLADSLRPKHNWVAIGGFALALLGAGWAIAERVASTPTREERAKDQEEMFRVRLELPTINAKVQRVDESQQRQEKAIERIEGKLDELGRKRR